MPKLTIENTKTFLEKYGDCDYTITLSNKNVAPPKRYIFVHLRLDGNTGLWMVHFLGQNLRPLFKETKEEFLEAKQILIREIEHYISKGYKITVLDTGIIYPPPWLERKR